MNFSVITALVIVAFHDSAIHTTDFIDLKRSIAYLRFE